MTPSPESYQPPVDSLLRLGDPREETHEHDYLALGLGPEHISELIRMVQDDALNSADSGSTQVWGPLHAWRALGQLRAEQAIQPLLGLLHRIDDADDDWVSEDLPEVFGQIGPAAIEPLEQYAAASLHPTFARISAASGLRKIGQKHPDARGSAVAGLTRLLENFAEPGRDPGLNGFLISDLVDLDADDTAPLMERAFAAGVVDESVVGDWEDVQIGLGLAAVRTTPRQRRTYPVIEETRKLARKAARIPAKAASETPSLKRKHHRRKK